MWGFALRARSREKAVGAEKTPKESLPFWLGEPGKEAQADAAATGEAGGSLQGRKLEEVSP